MVVRVWPWPNRSGCHHATPSIREDPVTLLRRALVALGLAGLVAAFVRLRGSGGTPPQSGGWRELSGPDLR